MRLVVSPAKKMNVVDAPPYAQGVPRFIDRTRELMEAVRAMSREEAQALWRCSDKLADLNYERFRTMELDAGLTAAVMSYEGIQYQHLAAQVMDEKCLDWLQGHLRILSGFYGVLRPLDGVVPYRLEMQAKLAVGGARDLYGYWGSALLDELVADGCSVVVNLASQEYAKAVVPYAREAAVPVLTCQFCTVRASDGKLVQQATEAKAARGTFVRWCAEKDVASPDALRGFDERGYALDASRSKDDVLVFVKQ
jgi:cytoplasmic iron level regulating protein YaaA (DUF328/UPF0246 family)